MILAEKINALRKKAGWSQEELADQLHVTRQSVSKWESAQSVPDLDKILQLSQIFGVSTDYLLKDELEQPEFIQADSHGAVRQVSMEEASAFLSAKAATAKPVALATLACILSPVCLLILAAGSDTGHIPISENAAAGIGLTVLLLMVAGATAVFLACGAKTKQFAYLEKEVFETAYGVEGMARARQAQYEPTYTRYCILGTVLCVLAAVPMFVALCFSEDDMLMVLMVAALLCFVGLGCVFFIVAGIRHASTQKLLQEGDYSKQQKERAQASSTVSTVYWLVVTAGFLAYSFAADSWQTSWIVWPVAGVLYAAVCVICRALAQRGRS